MTHIQDAIICLFPAGYDGRSGPFLTPKTQLGLVFPGTGSDMRYSAEIKVQSDRGIELGRIYLAHISIFNTEDTQPFIDAGMRFELFEGNRKIGVGAWCSDLTLS